MSILLVVGMLFGTAPALHASSVQAQAAIDPAPNPALNASCGIDVALVLDESGSIRDAEAIDDVQNATRAFLGGLADTGSRVALVEFASVADTVLDYTPVRDGADGSLSILFEPYLQADYDPPDSPYWYTNWNDAMKEVVLIDQGQQTDLVVFVTDGDPTAYNVAHPDAPADATIDDVIYNTLSTGPALTQTVEFADALKLGGTRIFAVGVGDALSSPESQERLKAVSGPDVWDGSTPLDMQFHDVALVADFANLEDALRQVAFALCGSSLTVNKQIAQAGGAIVPGAGWEFTAEVAVDAAGGTDDFAWLLPDPATAPDQPAQGRTNDEGALTFQWRSATNLGSAIAVSEPPRPGFRLASAECQVRSLANPDPQPLPITLNEAGFVTAMGPDDVVTCDVINQPHSEAIAVTIEPAQQLLRRGETATFSLTVHNLSGGDLSNITVNSSHCGAPTLVDGDINGDGVLQGSERWLFTCETPNVQNDFVNTVTADAVDPAGLPVEPAADQGVVQAMSPAIGVDIAPDAQVVALGGTATIDVVVSNPGDIALYNVQVAGDQFTTLTYIDGDTNGDGALQPDEEWRYVGAIENVVTDLVNVTTATANDPKGVPVDPAQDVAEIKVQLDDICQMMGIDAQPVRTKILGMGVGHQYETTLPATLNIPDADKLVHLRGQLTGKWYGALPDSVTFETPLQQVEMTEQTSLGDHYKYKMYTYETDLQPADWVTLSVDDRVVDDSYTPRGLVLYATYESGSRYFDLVRQTNTFVNWKMGVTEHTERVAIPALPEARTLYVAVVISDNRIDDERPVVVTASAGGVSTQVSNESPNRGSQLDIIYLKLPGVPAGTSEIAIQVASPDGVGDSIGLAGYSINFPCAPDSDGDGVPDPEEDLNADGNLENDDTDGDGVPNYLDADDDSDGIPTADEDANGDLDPLNDDVDGNGVPDYLGDGVVVPPVDPPVLAADLVLTKTATSGHETIAGATTSYRLVVMNQGPAIAEQVQLTDTLPAGVSVSDVSVLTAADAARTCDAPVPGADRVRCELGTLQAGERVEIALTVQSDPALVAESVLTNTATVSTASVDPELENNVDSAATTVKSLATLFTELHSSTLSPAAGELYVYRTEVRNNGPSLARNVSANVALPTEVTFVRSSLPCTLQDDPIARNYTCSLGDLGVGEAVVVEMEVQASGDVTCGPAWNSLAWAEAENMQGEAFASVDVVAGCTADLRVLKFGNDDGQLHASQPTTLTFMAENLGPEIAHGVVISGVIQTEGAYDILVVEPNPFGDRVHATCDLAAAFNVLEPRRVFTCVLDDELETLDPALGGGRWLVEVVIQSHDTQPLRTEARVSSHTPDPEMANNWITEESDPAILAGVSPPPDSDEDGIPDYRDELLSGGPAGVETNNTQPAPASGENDAEDVADAVQEVAEETTPDDSGTREDVALNSAEVDSAPADAPTPTAGADGVENAPALNRHLYLPITVREAEGAFFVRSAQVRRR